jgi:hypothetical protein
LDSRCLSLGVQILDLGLTEDAKQSISYWVPLLFMLDIHVGVAGRRLVDIGVVDDEEDLQQQVRTQWLHYTGTSPRGQCSMALATRGGNDYSHSWGGGE